ncbi:MAG: phosphoglycerate mutase, partial [Candidatus Diapherotrites archaeon]|nr:phosphoglycerate mutase [Candidatus Diapherotrites archaeon]
RIQSLGNKTTLEKAFTPNLDKLAEFGVSGRVVTVREDIAPESDVAVTALLGFDPFQHHTGRGPLESIGCRAHYTDGDIAFRANFATVNEDASKVVDRRVGRVLTTVQGRKLSDEMNSAVKLSHSFEFVHSIEHRGILIIRPDGKKLSSNVSNTDPAYERIQGLGVIASNPTDDLSECKPLDDSKEAKQTAELVNNFSKQAFAVLNSSPTNSQRLEEGLPKANYVLLRDAGEKLPKFPEKMKRKNWIGIAGMPLEIALSELCGMSVRTFTYPEIQKGEKVYDNLFKKLQTEIDNAKKVIKENSGTAKGFYVHFKPVDICGHDGNVEQKIRMIELLDKEFFSWIVKEIDLQKNRVLVTADHATPCELKNHSSDLVPILIAGRGVKADSEKTFFELNNGRLGVIKGIQAMQLFDKKEL